MRVETYLSLVSQIAIFNLSRFYHQLEIGKLRGRSDLKETDTNVEMIMKFK